ncbi:MAG: hypothetical protein ACR2MG_16970 [Pyrinomonadaceae bacterium]
MKLNRANQKRERAIVFRYSLLLLLIQIFNQTIQVFYRKEKVFLAGGQFEVVKNSV